MEAPFSAGRSARRAPRWLFEGTLVVASVGLGFGAAQLGEIRNERQLAARMLASLRAEIEYNLAVLEPMMPLHERWVANLNSADLSNSRQSALDVFFATRPELPANATPFPFLRRSAWDAALAGGALRLVEYDLTAALSEVYRMQEIVTENIDRLATGALSSATTYDPSSRLPSTRLLWLTLADIAAAEALLLGLYREHLPAIRQAADSRNAD